jgi:hypothetical protein
VMSHIFTPLGNADETHDRDENRLHDVGIHLRPLYGRDI